MGLSPKEAVALQRELAGRVVRETRLGPLTHVAGADVSLRDDRATAAVCVLRFPSLELVETATAERAASFPYVPGLLAFREMPALTAAFAKLTIRPDLVLVDGHGLAHPRRCGIACHLGVELDLPSIGCGKSRLVGDHAEPGQKRGAKRRLVDRGEVIGQVLRTRDGVRPMYVSTGHCVDLETATRLVLRCARGYRLPEPTRLADRLAGEASLASRTRRRKA